MVYNFLSMVHYTPQKDVFNSGTTLPTGQTHRHARYAGNAHKPQTPLQGFIPNYEKNSMANLAISHADL